MGGRRQPRAPRRQDLFTLTDSRPGIDAHRSSCERRVFRTRASRPQRGRQDRHGSMRARRPRFQDARGRVRRCSQDPRCSDSTEPGRPREQFRSVKRHCLRRAAPDVTNRPALASPRDARAMLRGRNRLLLRNREGSAPQGLFTPRNRFPRANLARSNQSDACHGCPGNGASWEHLCPARKWNSKTAADRCGRDARVRRTRSSQDTASVGRAVPGKSDGHRRPGASRSA